MAYSFFCPIYPFLSTPSARRATYAPGKNLYRIRDFYPRPPRGGRPPGQNSGSTATRISIHALREEGDMHLTLYGDPRTKFLSTPSARRATI